MIPEKRTVLNVDDHPFVLQGTKVTIEASGMFSEVHVAATAEDASRLAEEISQRFAAAYACYAADGKKEDVAERSTNAAETRRRFRYPAGSRTP